VSLAEQIIMGTAWQNVRNKRKKKGDEGHDPWKLSQGKRGRKNLNTTGEGKKT